MGIFATFKRIFSGTKKPVVVKPKPKTGKQSPGCIDIKKAGMVAAMFVPFALLTGCKSLGPSPEQANASLLAYQSFIAQQRSYESIRVVGTPEKPATFTMTGVEIAVSSALPPLSALGNDDTRARAFETLGSVLRMGIGAAAAAYGFSQFADSATNGTVYNVTQPAPAPAPVVP
jgi:hypothetical protein